MSTVIPPEHAVADALVGRADELDLLGAFLDDASIRGAALVLTGDAGVGKSALLAAADAAAVARGMTVLRAAGVEFEADVTFAGLNQVLLPLTGHVDGLGELHRDALSVALGLGEGAVPDRLVMSTAALMLMRSAADEAPLLVVVDDLPWLDRSSASVLGFVARRLAGGRIGFLASSRSDDRGFFDRGGIPTHEVRPLADDAATELVDARYPKLARAVRQRLLAESRGNPLVLLELPAALSPAQRQGAQALPTVLPLGRRLQDLFTARVRDLPVPTRGVLLLAALEGAAALRLLDGAAAMDTTLGHLAPAERAGLVQVDTGAHRVVFRHPLIRSAVVELSTSAERQEAHRSLAELLTDEPERRAWHLAEATVEPDEGVADLLEHAADAARRRGNPAGALGALTRAADLSPGRVDRARRLVEAAYVGMTLTGELPGAALLLADARANDPDLTASLHAAATAAFLHLNGDGDADTAHRLLVGAIEASAGRDVDRDTDVAALIDALNTLFLICRVAARPALWEPFHAAIARLGPRIPMDLHLLDAVAADSVHVTAHALEELDLEISRLHAEVEPWRIVKIASVAYQVDRLSGCREGLWRVAGTTRSGETAGIGITALFLLSTDALMSGQWDQADRLAREALELCDALDHRMLALPNQHRLALLAAARGDTDATRSLTEEMVQWGAPRGALSVVLDARQALLLASLSAGDYELAYHHATAITSPGEFPSHRMQAMLTMMDLVEAAVRTGRHQEATAHVHAMHELGIAAISSRLALLVHGSTAITASDAHAHDLFQIALALPGVDAWPFELARVQLAYGERLRRQRSIADARAQLTAALGAFERLRARPWITRASNELRAAGHAVVRNAPGARASLTPQEREIALLAASGRSNKEIGAELFLSHRTVGAHLYRIFPKLGVTSRAALRDALGAPGAAQADESER